MRGPGRIDLFAGSREREARGAKRKRARLLEGRFRFVPAMTITLWTSTVVRGLSGSGSRS